MPAIDPRTPVVVGVGQVTSRPDPEVPAELRPDPPTLMADAVRAAAADSGANVLPRAASLAVVAGFAWHPPNPGLVLAERLGIAPREVVLSSTGGNSPVTLLHRAARAIGRGELDVAVVVGGECLHTRALGARRGEPLPWPAQDAASTPPPVAVGVNRAPATELEVARGLDLPVHAYPLLEVAWRAAHGWAPAEHRARLGRLWSQFSEIATTDPHAWLPVRYGPEEIAEPGPGNRMISFPYTKLLTANPRVDQAAALVVTSVEAAKALGIPEDRWVFPLGGAEAHDHWYLSDRPELHRSPAIRMAGCSAFELCGVGPDDVGPVDLYSCFPVVVEMAAVELGLARPDDLGAPAALRPLTLTGGLTFFGGPGNDYAAHGMAALVDHLRRAPGTVGLATGLGWYATKHAVCVFASRPPVHAGAPYRWEDVQPSVDALPRCDVDAEATGPVTVEAYTVTYGREGSAERAVVACRTRSGARAWGNAGDPGELEEMVATEVAGRPATLHGDGSLTLG
jgi:acetyl-CoA C-acetyltransferase